MDAALTVEREHGSGLEIAHAEALAFGLCRLRSEIGAPCGEQFAGQSAAMVRECDAEVVAAFFSRRDGGVVVGHAHEDDLRGFEAATAEPREKVVVGIDQPCIAVGRVDAAVDIAKRGTLANAEAGSGRSGPALEFLYSVKRERTGFFADLAIFESRTAIPGTGGAAVLVFEGAREFSCARETRFERDLGDAPAGRGAEESGGAFEAGAADVLIEGLAGDALKDAVKVKRREAGDFREAREREVAVEMGDDVVGYAIDAFAVMRADPDDPEYSSGVRISFVSAAEVGTVLQREMESRRAPRVKSPLGAAG